MISLIFSLDYEIYGNGDGSISELVLEPAQKLMEITERYGARLSLFVEAAEFLRLKENRANEVRQVEEQVKKAFCNGHDVQLHLHPQWFNAGFSNGNWVLDFSEYNLAKLPPPKIREYLETGKAYLENIVGNSSYKCHTFRAGNWLLQPSENVVRILKELGFRFDSSVFRGGFDPCLGMDYRDAASPVYSWKFKASDINSSHYTGDLIEIPIFARNVLATSMLSFKRIAMQKRSTSHKKKLQPNGASGLRSKFKKFRFVYPKKFDFCRMTFGEMAQFLKLVVSKYDKKNSVIPVVLIGHSKDFVDDEAFENFLAFSREKYTDCVTFCTYSGLNEFYLLPGDS